MYLNNTIITSQDYIDADEKEIDALDWAEGTTDESRLACQTKVCSAFDGQTIRFIEMDWTEMKAFLHTYILVQLPENNKINQKKF